VGCVAPDLRCLWLAACDWWTLREPGPRADGPFRSLCRLVRLLALSRVAPGMTGAPGRG
jgi:hypothetical protein